MKTVLSKTGNYCQDIAQKIALVDNHLLVTLRHQVRAKPESYHHLATGLMGMEMMTWMKI